MSLNGIKILITSGSTYEPIDPVRFIGNRSSGKQGYAIAEALANAGADVFLISGPVILEDPKGVNVKRIESCKQMLASCLDVISKENIDVFISAAAVADWTVEKPAKNKMKKEDNLPPVLKLVENPDILKTISNLSNNRPNLVVGFAAETENVIEFAVQKKKRKGCDWMLANNVSPENEVFGGDENTINFLNEKNELEVWKKMSKKNVAILLADKIVEHFTVLKNSNKF